MNCVAANTPVEMSSSYRCAVTQHQCTAVLLRAKLISHCPVLLCKTGSQHAFWQCNFTHEDLLFMLVCMDPAPMHCSTAQGKPHFSLSSAALQNRLTACIVLLQIYLWRILLHTGLQSPSTNALQHCSVGNAFCQNQCCSALVLVHYTPA